MTKRLTVIVPTLNRPDFVERLLTYYANMGFAHRIAIGDSSNPANVAMTRAVLDRIGDRLDVFYLECPALSCHAAQKALIDSVDTPYVVSLPDDDFLLPSALDACMDFLDANPDYIAAHGWGVAMVRDPDVPDGVSMGFYPQPLLEADTPQQRLADLMRDYTVSAFSVHRAEAFRVMWAKSIAEYAFGELLPCCLTAVLGKIGRVDTLYLVRELHGRRYLSPDSFDWVTSDGWQSSYKVFRDYLAHELSTRGGISEGESIAAVKRAFWAYLSRTLDVNKDDGGSMMRLKQRLLAAPFIPSALLYGTRSLYHALNKTLGSSKDQLVLPALLSPGNPYSREFVPIYQAVAGR